MSTIRSSLHGQSQSQDDGNYGHIGPEGTLSAVDGGPASGGEDGSGSGGGVNGRKRQRKHQNDEEWNRQRKDNHKEVERRRRGNINQGINELAAIVPNSSSGEKAKGAILTRAVQYIHSLKENEARNIEKWTLEKLLMDQAMGDLQNQLEEVKRRWEMEMEARVALERELEALRNRSEEGGEVGQKRQRVE